MLSSGIGFTEFELANAGDPAAENATAATKAVAKKKRRNTNPPICFLLSAPGRNRTCDQEIRRLLLYPLSYEGIALEKGQTQFTKRTSDDFGNAH